MALRRDVMFRLHCRSPDKLNNSVGLAKFVRNVPPGILQEMKQEYGWSSLPREVAHDKASYMVSPFHDRLNVVFADALEAVRGADATSVTVASAEAAKKAVAERPELNFVVKNVM